MGTRLIHKDQRGFTLVELLIAIAITSVIAGAITGAIFQIFIMNTRTTNHMTAVRQVQQAGFWVSPDVQMAQSVDAPEGSGFPLTLTWTDWEGGEHEVVYTLEDMAGGFKKLKREHEIDSQPDSTTIVAEYIDPDQTSFVLVPGGGAYNFQVTATVGGESETRVYEAKPRPES